MVLSLGSFNNGWKKLAAAVPDVQSIPQVFCGRRIAQSMKGQSPSSKMNQCLILYVGLQEQSMAKSEIQGAIQNNRILSELLSTIKLPQQ